MFYQYGTTALVGPMVKNAANTYFYFASLCQVDSVYYFMIGRHDNGVNTWLQSAVLASPPAPYAKLWIEWNLGHLTATYNDSVTIEADDSTHAANGYAGLYYSVGSWNINDCLIAGGSALSLSVDPSTIGNYGACVDLSLTGTNTSWTPGTPGTPAFTVNHGSISAQEVLTATTATVTYCPGDYLGAATFTDPSTGLTDTIVVSSDPNVVPVSGTILSDEVVAWLEAQAAHGGLVVSEQQSGSEDTSEGIYVKGAFGEVLLGKRVSVGPEPTTAPDPAALFMLWQMLNGRNDAPTGPFTAPGARPVMHSLDFLAERWATSVDPWTVDQLVTALGGDPLASHQDILTALDGLEVTTDLQPVLDAIAAAQGDPLATIKAVLDLVYLLDPTGTHNLAEVLTAIGAVRGSGSPDLAAVMAKLGQVQPSTAVTLSSLNTQGVDLQGLLDTLALVIGVIAPEAGTVAELIALIYDAVTTATPAAPTSGPPVWIDEEHATIDSPIALSDGLLIEGPLDGVLVTITGSPSGATKFTFGDTDSWRYVGAVIFETDRGDAEWSQPIGLEAQIITPRTMQHASAARFRVSSGWTGTVRAFNVTAGA